MKIDIINNEDKCYYVSSYGLIKKVKIEIIN